VSTMMTIMLYFYESTKTKTTTDTNTKNKNEKNKKSNKLRVNNVIVQLKLLRRLITRQRTLNSKPQKTQWKLNVNRHTESDIQTSAET